MSLFPNGRLIVETLTFTPSGARITHKQDAAGATETSAGVYEQTLDTPAIPAGSAMVIRVISIVTATPVSDAIGTNEHVYLAKNVSGTVTVYGPISEDGYPDPPLARSLGAAAQGTAVRITSSWSDNPT